MQGSAEKTVISPSKNKQAAERKSEIERDGRNVSSKIQGLLSFFFSSSCFTPGLWVATTLYKKKRDFMGLTVKIKGYFWLMDIEGIRPHSCVRKEVRSKNATDLGKRSISIYSSVLRCTVVVYRFNRLNFP